MRPYRVERVALFAPGFIAHCAVLDVAEALEVSSHRYTVTCHWDDEARVWYVADSNVLGLATEAETFEQLEQKLRAMIPQLLELNAPDISAERTSFRLIAEKDALALSV
jgi:predicted RNase H-like HicB family nuclease